MRTEEKMLDKFIKEKNLTSLVFTWGTNFDSHYIAYNSNGEEISIHYNKETEKIAWRVG